jgi:hypothetical protein
MIDIRTLPRVLAVAATDACFYYLLAMNSTDKRVGYQVYIDPCHALDAVQNVVHLVLLLHHIYHIWVTSEVLEQTKILNNMVDVDFYTAV